MPANTRLSFYRRLYIAYLIDVGEAATVPAIVARTDFPRRTVQAAIVGLQDIGVVCRFVGPNRAGHYVIDDWGPIRSEWIEARLAYLRSALGCPS